MLFGGAYIISRSPGIINTWCGITLDKLVKLSKFPGSIIFLHLPWDHANYKMLRVKLQVMLLKIKGYYPVLMTNSKEEYFFQKIFGIKGTKCTSYIFTNENYYKVLDVEKRYDAVYAAQMKAFKRMELAQLIDKLFVLTYTSGKTSGFDLHGFCPDLKHADFNRNWVDTEGKNKLFNQSRVGLCLSKVEGPMLASFEYMLAGLPVVSTPSKGGRSEYYEPEYSLVVDPNPRSVKKGVEEMIARQVDPEYIRNKTIQKLKKEREIYIEYIVDLMAKKEGVKMDPQKLYEDIFSHPEKNFKDYKDLLSLSQI